MPAPLVNLEITIGEDWTIQIESVDAYDRPKPIRAPGRMDIKQGSQLLHSLVTDLDADPLTIPGMVISSEVAVIQLHIPRSVSSEFQPGAYRYDLWVTVDDEGAYAGPQALPEIQGQFIVLPRVTEDF